MVLAATLAAAGLVLENSVVVSAAGDVDSDNDVRTNTDARVSEPRLDFNLGKSADSGVLVPGGWIHYGINSWNQGNTAAQAWVTRAA